MLNKFRRFGLRYLKKMTFLPSEIYAHFLYEYFTGKKLNLEKPIEFNEKVQWYKVFYRPRILNQLADKYAVRSYVEQKIGVKYLNEIYGIYESYKEVDFSKLPNQFIIKGVHASSYNLIVKDKTQLDIKKARELFKKWLSTNQYYRTGQEWSYKDIKPKLMAEKYIEEEGKSSLTDYKFYCFNGVVKFLEIHLNRTQNHKSSFYDLEFNKLPFRCIPVDETISEDVKKPKNFEEMISLAEKLALGFPFVRVDFYSIKNQIIFGEMTFYPRDGRKDFYPDKYNTIIGDYFQIPQIPSNKKCITEVILD